MNPTTDPKHNDDELALVAAIAGAGDENDNVDKKETSDQIQTLLKKTVNSLLLTIENIPKPGRRVYVPHGLTVDLFEHQRYGLEWVHWRESQYPGGGILAYEMGLGKTIILLALILRTKAPESMLPSSSSVLMSCPCCSSSNSSEDDPIPSEATLIVVPPSILQQWEDEIESKTNDLTVAAFHGPDRTRINSLHDLVHQDIVLTTYQTVNSEIKLNSSSAKKSLLQKIRWKRVVLDEGHQIRNSKTQNALAIYQLAAVHRWVVTGTPIHNHASDMYSLVKFLRVEPFDDWKIWEKLIGLKIVTKVENLERLSMLARALVLRRTKEEVRQDGQLAEEMSGIPPKLVENVFVEMSPEERKLYNQLLETAQKTFKTFLRNREQRQEELIVSCRSSTRKLGALREDYSEKTIQFSHMLVLLLRLRQASVLPYLIHSKENEVENYDSSSSDDEHSQNDYDKESEAIKKERNCKTNPIFARDFKSAKLTKVLADLKELKATTQEKVIIVSQWTTLLSVLATHLDNEGYSYEIISGDVSLTDRADIVDEFNSITKKGGPDILLLSLTAGGVGLNLFGANRMYFLDIHYNPQLELQAHGRIHRYGQKKNVYITRYLCTESMEQRVLDLQTRKLELANGLLSATNNKNSSNNGAVRLCIDDIKLLFNIH